MTACYNRRRNARVNRVVANRSSRSGAAARGRARRSGAGGLRPLVDELERRAERLAALERAAALVTSSLEIAEVTERLVVSARELLRMDQARLWVADPDGEYLALGASAPRSGSGQPPSATRLPIVGSLIGLVFSSGDVFHTADVLTHPMLRNIAYVREAGFHGCIAIPLRLRGAPYAALALFSRERREFSADEIELLRSLGNHAVIALEHARLFGEASRAQALQELQELKGEFLSAISHELAAPLTAIVGFAHVLREMEPSQEEVRRIGGVIGENAQALSRMIEDLLELSRLETGRFSLRLDQTDLADLARAVVASYVVQADRHRIVFEAEADLAPVPADPDRIRQVLANLVSNAVRYSPQGGTITVTLRHDKDAHVVEVVDEGIGINSEDLAHVFEPFYRARTEAAHHVRGAGLGLAIVKELVEAHGGGVWVESEPGRGSRFGFALPLVASLDSRL